MNTDKFLCVLRVFVVKKTFGASGELFLITTKTQRTQRRKPPFGCGPVPRWELCGSVRTTFSTAPKLLQEALFFPAYSYRSWRSWRLGVDLLPPLGRRSG